MCGCVIACLRKCFHLLSSKNFSKISIPSLFCPSMRIGMLSHFSFLLLDLLGPVVDLKKLILNRLCVQFLASLQAVLKLSILLLINLTGFKPLICCGESDILALRDLKVPHYLFDGILSKLNIILWLIVGLCAKDNYGFIRQAAEYLRNQLQSVGKLIGSISQRFGNDDSLNLITLLRIRQGDDVELDFLSYFLWSEGQTVVSHTDSVHKDEVVRQFRADWMMDLDGVCG